ncbi:MAG TPA: hypothetical protein VFN65_01520, partial [Solirubrobacteraceae bacterium]|nr:hypothetical protein [Solirubrobacteraceae bacterium]
RELRYGAPAATVIVGVLFAAVETNSLGNTVSLVLIGGGLVWFLTTLGRDMGMTADTGRTPRVPDLQGSAEPPPAPEPPLPAPEPPSTAPEPPSTAAEPPSTAAEPPPAAVPPPR